MRLRPLEPFCFSILGTLYVVVFGFQLILLVFVICIVMPAAVRPSTGYVIEEKMNLDWKLATGVVVRANRPSATELDRWAPVLHQQLARYQRKLIQAIGLRQIILCSQLTVAGKELGGLTIGSSGTILLNLRDRKPGDNVDFRRAIHHELFHVMDLILDPETGKSESWTRLNPKNFAYGGDEILRALEVTNEHPDRRTEIPGLLNYYSMVSAKEDRAEIFSYMMVLSDELAEIAVEDESIMMKIEALKRELRQFSRDFDDIIR